MVTHSYFRSDTHLTELTIHRKQLNPFCNNYFILLAICHTAMTFAHKDTIGIWHYQHYREKFEEKWPENLRRRGLNSPPCAPHPAQVTLLSCVLPAFSVPWNSCWVEGLLEAVTFFMAKVWTRPVQGIIRPSKTYPTARLASFKVFEQGQLHRGYFSKLVKMPI